MHKNIIYLTPVVYFIGFSFISVIRTYGLTLLEMILIKFLFLHKREKINYFEALKLSVLASVFSTIIGILFVGFTYNSVTSVFFGLILFSCLFAYILTSFCKNTGYFKKFIEKRKGLFFLLSVLLFVILGLSAPFLGVLTVPGHDYTSKQLYFSTFYDIVLAVLGAGGLMTIGFIISFIVDGFVIARSISEKRPSLTLNILFMNIISYLVIIITSGFYIWETIVGKTWFFH